MEFDLAILGAGAAGMMAAVAAGEAAGAGGGGHEAGDRRDAGAPGFRIGVFEKNSRPGVKVLVCGGGRCNFTNAGSREFLIGQFGRNGRYLTPALEHLDNEGLRAWFQAHRVPSHEEHDGKIYPDSNKAKSVVDALLDGMARVGAQVFTGSAGTVCTVERADGWFVMATRDGQTHRARQVLLALGGMSYQRMGTTGDGYRIAQSLGHSLVTPRPAIVGLLVEESWPRELQGLAVPDVEARIVVEGGGVLPKLATGKPTPSVNDMLFTHFGLSGPAILNVSEIVAELLEKFPPMEAGAGAGTPRGRVSVRVDFARHFSHERLHGILRSWQQHHGKKLVRKMLAAGAPEVLITSTSPDQTSMDNAPPSKRNLQDQPFCIPRRLAEKFCELEGIAAEQPCSTLSAGQMHGLVLRLKQSTFIISGTRGFKEAMVTAGGIALAEVNPKTMESKIVPGLFVTGEVLDLTGPSGGYNLQLAFSTGHLAGTVIGEKNAAARRSMHDERPPHEG